MWLLTGVTFSSSSSALSSGAGDFHQLPPVAKGREAAAARKFAFEAASWRQSIHHCIQLTKVFRQVHPNARDTPMASDCVDALFHVEDR